MNGPAKYTPECLHVIWSGAYSFILSLNICSLPLTFYFRYLLIKRGRCLNGFELIKLAMFPFAASLFFWTAFSSCFYVSNWKFPEHSFLHDNPFLFNAINSSPTIVIAELTSIPMYIVISVTAFGGLLVLWIILFCSWSIYLELKKVREEHAQLKTLRLQRQMTITLSVQTLGVFASALLPLFILITLMVCKFDVQGAGSTVSLILSFLPSLNPLSTLMFVTRFRRRAFTLLFCGKRFGYKIENTTEATASMRQTKMAVSTIR
ncbi:hypothetical protein M3Y94_01059200 [Aphelenchoides besseyi]|nr:hypothetical protein M3Y94_01059200 [Aphelenchoides besseyi]